jgi:hypothetical protein
MDKAEAIATLGRYLAPSLLSVVLEALGEEDHRDDGSGNAGLRLIKYAIIDDYRVVINTHGLVFSENTQVSAPVIWLSLENAAKLRDFLVEHLPDSADLYPRGGDNAPVENEEDEESLVGADSSELLYHINPEG